MANPDKTTAPVVRFAPSPTGYLHVGGARTALFNYLFARHHNGTFILRIEDTDQKRFQPEALAEIFTSLKWLGLNWDEGPEAGGERGPYFQSQRTATYRCHGSQLLDENKAYRCFCSEERLTNMREEQEKARMAQGSGYDRHCRSLPSGEAAALQASGTPCVVRLKIPDDRSVTFNDMIRGPISYQSAQLDDLVLLKSDGFPTYHLANVVDDHLMGITHVLRGDEWIASTPKHILIYEAFGWTPPLFAHMPVILAADGGKLSKRRGAASVLDYQRNGILPQSRPRDHEPGRNDRRFFPGAGLPEERGVRRNQARMDERAIPAGDEQRRVAARGAVHIGAVRYPGPGQRRRKALCPKGDRAVQGTQQEDRRDRRKSALFLLRSGRV
jgi:glutamyl-tRNA synthetase